MTAPELLAVMTLHTPPGSPASSRIFVIASIDSGVCLAGLTTIVQPAAIAGPDLARAHRQREVPRRDEHARADRLLHRQHAALAVLVDREAAVDADRLLAVPAEEVGGVDDLGLGLGDGLAHLERHQQRQVVLALDDHVVGAAQDVAALARRHVAEVLERVGRRLQRGVGVLGVASATSVRVSPVAGSSTGSVPAEPSRHSPPM
jgi:hypothetical protein